MRRLDVSPLPCFDATEEACSPYRTDVGFVEDSVVVALLTAPCSSGGWETWPGMPELAGALDYAGWPSTGSAAMRRTGAC